MNSYCVNELEKFITRSGLWMIAPNKIIIIITIIIVIIIIIIIVLILLCPSTYFRWFDIKRSWHFYLQIIDQPITDDFLQCLLQSFLYLSGVKGVHICDTSDDNINTNQTVFISEYVNVMNDVTNIYINYYIILYY